MYYAKATLWRKERLLVQCHHNTQYIWYSICSTCIGYVVYIIVHSQFCSDNVRICVYYGMLSWIYKTQAFTRINLCAIANKERSGKGSVQFMNKHSTNNRIKLIECSF